MKMAIIIRQVLKKKKKSQVLESEEDLRSSSPYGPMKLLLTVLISPEFSENQHFYTFFHEVFAKPKWDNQYESNYKTQTHMSSYCCRGFIQHLNMVVFVSLTTLAGGSQLRLCAYRRCPCQALPATLGDGCRQTLQTHCCRPQPWLTQSF